MGKVIEAGALFKRGVAGLAAGWTLRYSPDLKPLEGWTPPKKARDLQPDDGTGHFWMCDPESCHHCLRLSRPWHRVRKCRICRWDRRHKTTKKDFDLAVAELNRLEEARKSRMLARERRSRFERRLETRLLSCGCRKPAAP